MANAIVFLAAAGLIVLVLDDVFETIVLPRRVTRRWRITALVYRLTWLPFRTMGMRQRPSPAYENLLSYFGPLSIIMLLALWVVGLLFGFALILWALGSPIKAAEGGVGFGADLYVSGTTFFTLGLGDVMPTTAAARLVTVVEVGIGFAVLALVISYLPILYQAFSRREVAVSLLDARAGSPPSAVELISRHAESGQQTDLADFLRDWELWSAELLESHLSYPVLGLFRSQHDNQSWLAALTTVLDTCALVIACDEHGPVGQARLTFAIARHAAVDLCQVFEAPPRPPQPERLSPEEFAEVRERLAERGIGLRAGSEVEEHLQKLRQMYEPYVNALSGRLLMALPPWLPHEEATDNWRSTAWEPRAGARLL